MKHVNFFKFLEKKDHLIKKLDLTDEQKQEAIDFFTKHPNYESEIDWNRKDLTWEDFNNVINKVRSTKSQIKKAVKRGIEGIEEGIDYLDLGTHSLPSFGNVYIYQPLTWKGSRVLASDQVDPKLSTDYEGYTGAKWCISYQKTDQYWESYYRNYVFAFVFGDNIPTKKLAIQIYRGYLDVTESYTCWNSLDDVIDECPYEILQTVKKLTRKMYLRMSPRKNFLDWVAKYTNPVTGLVDAPEVSYEVLKDNYYDLFEDGHLTVKFGEVEGDFILEAFEAEGNLTSLTTLEGCPSYVGGNFKCTDHKQLTSLKGCPSKILGNFICESLHSLESLEYAPKEVGRSFICFDCGIKSLEGSPKVVYDAFDCRQCFNIKDLKGGPETVYGLYFCSFCSSLTSLEGAPTITYKSFDCRNCDNLRSLKGAPKVVNGDFMCAFSNLSSLKDGPEEVRDHFICCYSGRIKDLTGAPKKVGGNFLCHNMINLTSLKGAPEYVGGNFSCFNNNKLTSLEYSPKEVGRDFDCGNCSITSLEGSPRIIGGQFKCTKNKDLVSLKGAPDYIGDTFYVVGCGVKTLEYLPKEVKGRVELGHCDDLEILDIPEDLKKPYKIYFSNTPISSKLGKTSIILR